MHIGTRGGYLFTHLYTRTYMQRHRWVDGGDRQAQQTFCLSVCLFACLCLSVSLCLSLSLSVFVYLSVYVSVSPNLFVFSMPPLLCLFLL